MRRALRARRRGASRSANARRTGPLSAAASRDHAPPVQSRAPPPVRTPRERGQRGVVVDARLHDGGRATVDWSAVYGGGVNDTSDFTVSTASPTPGTYCFISSSHASSSSSGFKSWIVITFS